MFPPNLSARVRYCLMPKAHETAGAARTRSSLRPRFEGANEMARLGRKSCREDDDSHFVVPAHAGTHTPCRLYLSSGSMSFLNAEMPGVMGPRLRGDDGGDWGARNALNRNNSQQIRSCK